LGNDGERLRCLLPPERVQEGDGALKLCLRFSGAGDGKVYGSKFLKVTGCMLVFLVS
jgi:hypothetical protein